MKRVAKLLLPLVFMFFANMSAFASVAIKTVEAHQRYPWNGLVDIAVTFEGSAEDVAKVDCSFEAMNSATYRSVPIKSVVWNDSDAGFGTNWTRRFIWNATKDVGDVVIDDLKITVNANDEKVLGGRSALEERPLLGRMQCRSK